MSNVNKKDWLIGLGLLVGIFLFIAGSYTIFYDSPCVYYPGPIDPPGMIVIGVMIIVTALFCIYGDMTK